ADLRVRSARLKGGQIGGSIIPRLVDEIPALAVAALLADGPSEVRDAAELRVKETDRIVAIAHNLRAMGAQVVELEDGLEIQGRAELRGARVASFGDHRIAMAFAIAGMFADGETIIQDVECVRESYPGFEKALDEFVSAKRIRVTTPVISSLTPGKVDEE
ncbi:MAG: 3-phosphoshikimate 1-carboxyvinyltransferase, partial [Chthoniobacterales bacterium]